MHPSLSKRIARVATALEGLDKPKMPKRALAEGKGDKLPTEINLDKATPKRIAPIVNNVDGRLKNIDKYTDALVTALEAKKEDKVKSVMKSLKTQIDALHKWLMQDVTRLVTASSKKSYSQCEAAIKRARTAYAKANKFLATKKTVARVPKRAGKRAASTKTAAFMEPSYWKTTMYVVETNDGDVMYPKDDFSIEQVCDETGATKDDVSESSGWFARLSAPGYMDSTDWSGPFPSHAVAMKHIEDMYDVNPETGDDLDSIEDDEDEI